MGTEVSQARPPHPGRRYYSSTFCIQKRVVFAPAQISKTLRYDVLPEKILSDECKFLGEIHMQWVIPPVTLCAFVFPMGHGPLMSYICNCLYSATWAEWLQDFLKCCLSKFCSSRRGKRVREKMTKQLLVNVWFPERDLFRVVDVGFIKVLFLEAWLWEQIRHNCQMILTALSYRL